MPNPLTQPQREALAALVGITPESHPWLYRLRQEEYPDGTGYWEEWEQQEGFPCPLTGGIAADRVWLPDTLYYLTRQMRCPSVSTPPGSFFATCMDDELRFKHTGDYLHNYTAALLLAARSAGVPEVVAVFDMGAGGK